MSRTTLLILSLSLLAGCEYLDNLGKNEDGNASGDGSSGGSGEVVTLECPESEGGIAGCWVTEECGRARDDNGQLTENWGNMRVLFSENRQVQFLAQQYDNSACTGAPVRTTELDNLEASYADGQPTMDESGVDASQVIVTAQINNEAPFDTPVTYFISDAYRLCLSQSLRIGRDSVDIGQPTYSAIDFGSCLTRPD